MTSDMNTASKIIVIFGFVCVAVALFFLVKMLFFISKKTDLFKWYWDKFYKCMISKYYRYGSNPLDMDDRDYTDKYIRQYKQSKFINIKNYESL